MTFANLPKPFDKSPLHIETDPFSSVDLTPLDVALGYKWATKTPLRESGVLSVPSNWRNNGSGGTTSPIYVVYRQDGVWKRALQSGVTITYKGGTPETSLKVRLKNVPRDAEEVRVRGQFQSLRLYRGPLPPGWTSPVAVRHAGLNHFFYISSKPFDLSIKSEEESWPAPQVSHQQKIELVEGKWLRDWQGNELLIRFRAKSDSGISGTPLCAVYDLRYFDATGRQFTVFQDATSTVEAMSSGESRQWCSPDLPKNEEVVRIAQTEAQPRGGWDKIKMPITVTGLVSDGECWPTPFKVKIAPQAGEMKDYGARIKPALTPGTSLGR